MAGIPFIKRKIQISATERMETHAAIRNTISIPFSFTFFIQMQILFYFDVLCVCNQRKRAVFIQPSSLVISCYSVTILLHPRLLLHHGRCCSPDLW